VQEVQPALAVTALEGGEQVVANRHALAILALMARPGVIGADVRRLGQPRRQHLGLFLMESVFPFRQDVVELARRDVDAVLPELLEE
jgi:hypothetical protein